MLISFLDIVLIASGIAAWIALGGLWMWRKKQQTDAAQPHAPTLAELDARAAVAIAKAAEARRCHTRPVAPAPPLLEQHDWLRDPRRRLSNDAVDAVLAPR